MLITYCYRLGGQAPAARQARGPSAAARQARMQIAAARVHISVIGGGGGGIEKNISMKIYIRFDIQIIK